MRSSIQDKRFQVHNQDYVCLPSDQCSHLKEQLAGRLCDCTPSLVRLTDRIALACSYDIPVLITGETGTGKTYLARLIHEYSPRKDEPFLVVPCGALAPNLVESEFFGYCQGAFTGADRAKAGKFEAAGAGTLLLDEIDALGLEQQAALLRVIETGEYEPVGSNETRISKARIIAASNLDPDEAVERGILRGDVYYRLHVLSLHLQPLRRRLEDIAPLVRSMITHFSSKFGKQLVNVTSEALVALEVFPWPGNVRELENVVQQAVLLSRGGHLEFTDLPPAVREHTLTHVGNPRATNRDSLADSRQIVERNIIYQALARNDYNRSRAAHTLGISRVALYNKMKKYGITCAKRWKSAIS